MSKNKQILMIGPDSKGGITSVIRMYLDNGLINYVDFLPSYKGRSFVFNICYYMFFLVKYIFILAFNRDIKIVHIHFSMRGSFLRKLFVLNIAKLFNKKTIFHSHLPQNDILFGADSVKLINKLIKNTLNKPDLLLVLSNNWKKALETKCSNSNISVLYNPVKIRPIEQKNNDQTVNVLFMGRVEARKGIYDLVESAKFISNPYIKILVYGDGEVEKARKLVSDFNLDEKIQILGWISGEDIDKAYRNANIVVLPSYAEGLPMTLLEAAAYSLPIISTPVGGIPDIVTDGINGYLISQGDYRTLAEKIDLLANNEHLRTSMGQKSYEIACEKFDISVIIDNLTVFYKALL